MAPLRSKLDGFFGAITRVFRPGWILLVFAGLTAGPASAQPAAPDVSAFQAQVEKTMNDLVANNPGLRRFPVQQRRALVEFVIGNMLFVSTHELGHGVLAELELPNLGRDEDAADAFAILTMLKVGNSFSDRVLVEAAKGWYLADRRDRKKREKPAYYDEHGMNLQRAYQIVCFMVGAHPEKFKELADQSKMPEERQESCKIDFRFAAWSWETLLKPHVRADDKPRQDIEIIYGDGKGRLDVFARSFREIRFLETLAEHLGGRFAWPRPFTMEMQSCGEVGASWRARKLKLCYEMAQDFARLYRDFGQELKPSKPKRKR